MMTDLVANHFPHSYIVKTGAIRVSRTKKPCLDCLIKLNWFTCALNI
jgi:hypothetical protein